MLSLRLMVAVMIPAMLMTVSPTLWADRDMDDRRIQREQHRPQRPEARGGRVEIQERGQQPPGQVQRPAVTPVQRVTPEKPHAVTPGRPSTPMNVTPPSRPIKDWRQETRVSKEPPKPGWVLDSRYKHNHYYPPRGMTVDTVPPASRVIVHHNQHYHYHDGIWYRRHNSRFIVVLPPYGIYLPILPPFYTTVWVGSYPYYYAGGVYYSWWPAYQQYVVVEPPPEDKVRATNTSNGESEPLYIYPAAGQSEEQQARDRYECHRWAQNETGFDPTLPDGGVPGDQHTVKRADYYRAMKACLEARNYSVQ